MLLAKQPTAIRFFRVPTSSRSDSRTSASEPEAPSTNTLVESQTIASTPPSPSRRRAASSVASPTSGVGSNFQSPVCRTAPSGVRTTTALGSGIECVRVMSSTSNGASDTLPDIGMSVIGASRASPASSSLRRRTDAVNGVAYSGHRSCGHK
jgi:hypothetical protein